MNRPSTRIGGHTSGLTAAATRFTTRRIQHMVRRVNQSWQKNAWTFYDSTPEVRFAANWISDAMQGARLIAGRRGGDGSVEPAPKGHRASELVASIAGGVDGQSQLLARFGSHLTVAGEGWTIIRPRLGGEGLAIGEDWHVLSVAEVAQQGDSLQAEIDGVPVVIPAYDPDKPADPSTPIAIRVWEPHPMRHIEADSPVRSSLGLLEELHLLNAAVAAIARSRLTGRGVLLIPKGARFPTKPSEDDGEDDLLEVFMTVAETAYKEPESAAATIPIILEVPAELISDIKHLTFESSFDELALKLREEAIRRFATSLEIPAEILLGMGNVNHWGVWQLSSEAIRLGIEPKLATVCHALTTQWMRPILEAENVPDAEEWLVWYDTAPLRVRQSRSATALELYDRGAISAPALRRETGFDESDAPTGADARPQQRQPRNTLPVDEDPRPPSSQPNTASAAIGRPGEGLLAAADMLIWAALHTAGEKIVRTPACPRSERGRAKTAPAAVHTLVRVEQTHVDQWRLLDGAWTRVPEVAARYGVDPDCLTDALDTYARELIAAGISHTWDQTSAALRTPCLMEAV